MTTWPSLGIRPVRDHAGRFEFAPYGPLDFVILNAPIDSCCAGRLGVVFQCLDGGIYFLYSDCHDISLPQHWRIELLRRV